MNIQAVIFDLDGTLIDSIRDIADSCNEILIRNNFSVHPIESYIKWIGNGARLLIERAVPEIDDPEIIDRLLSAYISKYAENCNIKTRMYPGMDNFLDLLNDKNIPVSILTNKPHSETLKIAGFYLKKWPFRFILGQREDIPKKPDPQMALQIAKDLNVEPSNILFIGDSSTDIKTAIAAGMEPIGVTWGYGTVQSMKDAGGKIFCNGPNELPGLI